MENRAAEKKILNDKEAELVVGGFKYNGILEWLKGHDIVCPNCGNEHEDSVKKRYATGLHMYYTCGNCGQKFFYTLGPNSKVKVYKE